MSERLKKGLPRCHICGKVVHYDLWAHVEACARERQRKADESRVGARPAEPTDSDLGDDGYAN